MGWPCIRSRPLLCAKRCMSGHSSRCKKIGMPLEVLSEEEARLISLGIISGLRFHLPLGLFLDIGGGSLEMAVANSTMLLPL